jgi:hypothetical protein
VGRFLVLAAAGAVAVAGVAGCTKGTAEAPPPPTSLVATQWPASVAGGACQLLDYPTIEAATRVRFDVAAASQQGRTLTCVVQHSDASRSDLTLAVTATTADAAVFGSTMVPEKAQRVSGLGKAAYKARLPATKTQGPSVEVGWLSADQRLITLRFTFPPGAGTPEVDAMSSGLVDLAKKVDKAKA